MKRISFIVPAVLSTLFLMGKLPLSGQGTSAAVSEDEAHKLVVSTLTLRARRLVGMRFDPWQPKRSDGFYSFELSAKVPDGMSPLLGHFAVNKTTGDVWDAVSCAKLKSSIITQFQKRIRQKGSISTSEFRRIGDQAPCEP